MHTTSTPDAVAVARVRRSEDVIERTIADETFLLPVKGEVATRTEMFVLSAVGRFLWARLDGTREVRALAAEVVDVFDVPLEQAAADAREFVDQLLLFKLVLPVGA